MVFVSPYVPNIVILFWITSGAFYACKNVFFGYNAGIAL
jgi:hypothetical protein